MNANSLTNETKKAIGKAYDMAVELGFTAIEPPLLALVIFVHQRSMAEAVLREKNLPIAEFIDTLAEAVSNLPRHSNPQTHPAEQPDISDDLNSLLVACAEDNRQVTPEKVFRAVVRQYCPDTPQQTPPARPSGQPRETERPRQGRRSALSLYARDLKQQAADNKLSPVIGRENEMEQVITTLLRKDKPNPILVGHPGVGKTAVVEGVAMRINKGDVPGRAAAFHIYALDLPQLVAGASAAGQFEQRLKDVIAEAKADPDIVLFIDEIHSLIGTGTNPAMDAANILKPALARGEIKVIGATTDEEKRQIFDNDKALERRVQPIRVEEPSPEDTLTILRGIKTSYEKHHGLTIEDASLEKAVELSSRFMTERYQPDKAKDVMDQAAAATQYHKGNLVTVETIYATISKLTGIPVEKLGSDEKRSLLNMEERLRMHVLGQDEAIHVIAEAIRSNKVNLSDTTRPIGSFFFLGPTGTGKTELAKTLADLLTGSRDNMLRLDMSEYQAPHNVARLIGAPPGYVGYGRGGQLTEAVRQKPYCVILLDEIEKAHPRVAEVLLQVLDDGRLTDGEGRVVNFKNTIIIMTSNIGSHEVAQRRTPIGFNAPAPETVVTDVAKEALKAHFPPEFINRIDEIVCFNALDSDLLLRIARKQIGELAQRLAANGHTVTFDDAVANFVVETDADPAYGARPINRVIKRHLEAPIARRILETEGDEPLTLHVSVRDGKPVFESAQA